MKFYEQGVSKKGVGLYWKWWLGWAIFALAQNAFATPCDDARSSHLTNTVRAHDSCVCAASNDTVISSLGRYNIGTSGYTGGGSVMTRICATVDDMTCTSSAHSPISDGTYKFMNLTTTPSTYFYCYWENGVGFTFGTKPTAADSISPLIPSIILGGLGILGVQRRKQKKLTIKTDS